MRKLDVGTDDCAVVGSSDILRITPMGREIDAHRTIWRANNAPTVGFEDLAGSRTDVRMVNHVMLDVWAGAKILSQKERDEGRGANYRRHLYDMSMCIGRRCFLTDTGPLAKQRLANLTRAHPELTMTPLPFEAATAVAARCLGQGGVSSLGYATVLIALASCTGPVHLFGFMPHCCPPSNARFGWPPLNYKYSHTNSSAFVCCSAGRERMDLEFNHYVKLARAGRVRLYPQPLAWGPLHNYTEPPEYKRAMARSRSPQTRAPARAVHRRATPKPAPSRPVPRPRPVRKPVQPPRIRNATQRASPRRPRPVQGGRHHQLHSVNLTSTPTTPNPT